MRVKRKYRKETGFLLTIRMRKSSISGGWRAPSCDIPHFAKSYPLTKTKFLQFPIAAGEPESPFGQCTLLSLKFPPSNGLMDAFRFDDHRRRCCCCCCVSFSNRLRRGLFFFEQIHFPRLKPVGIEISLLHTFPYRRAKPPPQAAPADHRSTVR